MEPQETARRIGAVLLWRSAAACWNVRSWNNDLWWSDDRGSGMAVSLFIYLDFPDAILGACLSHWRQYNLHDLRIWCVCVCVSALASLPRPTCLCVAGYFHVWMCLCVWVCSSSYSHSISCWLPGQQCEFLFSVMSQWWTGHPGIRSAHGHTGLLRDACRPFIRPIYSNKPGTADRQKQEIEIDVPITCPQLLFAPAFWYKQASVYITRASVDATQRFNYS